jgi:hypothetical protein
LFVQSPFPTSCGSAVGVVEKMNEQERATFRFGAMSGCVMSTPPSMTPTRTPLPVATAYEPPVVAWIWSMSHWHGASGSDDGTAPPITGASRLVHMATALGVVSAGDAAGTRQSEATTATTAAATTRSVLIRSSPWLPPLVRSDTRCAPH